MSEVPLQEPVAGDPVGHQHHNCHHNRQERQDDSHPSAQQAVGEHRAGHQGYDAHHQYDDGEVLRPDAVTGDVGCYR